MIKGLDHIGVVVENIEDCLHVYTDVLGMELVEIEEVPEQKVRVAILKAGGVHVELVEPAGEDSPAAKHLDARGPGLHPRAWRVDGRDAALSDLKEKGVRLVDEKPRKGAGGKLVAFIHPKSTRGVLTELIELP